MATDPILDDLVRLIREHGWAVRLVVPRIDEPGVPFAYTVGLTAMGHPEIVETGLPGDVGHEFLNLVGQEVKEGRRFMPGSVVNDLSAGGQPVAFLAVEDTSELTAIEQVYGTVDALQMVWSDSAGHLPWQPEFASGAESQPLLGVWREA